MLSASLSSKDLTVYRKVLGSNLILLTMVVAIDSIAFLMEVVVEAVMVVVVMVAAAVVLLVAFVVGFEQNSDGHGSCQCSHPKPCNPNPSGACHC